MAPWFMALITGARKLVSKTFTSNATFTIPAGVTNLVAASGKGSDGTQSTLVSTPYYTVTTTTRYFKRAGGYDDVVDVGTNHYYDTKPGDYCDPFEADDESTIYSGSQRCYSFIDGTETTGSPAAPGVAASGFGKTFPGGAAAAPAAVTSYSNVPVTPGSYSVTVPAGGSITITYYQ